MEETNVMQLLDGLSDRLRLFAESVRIVGEPITHGDKIIIPVISVSTGFAGGGGGGSGGKDRHGMGTAGGGGGGIRISPKGFLVISDDDVKLLSFGSKSYAESIATMIPEVIEKVRGVKGQARAASASPEEES
jgi:uncharacterized spore protein YtfJ